MKASKASPSPKSSNSNRQRRPDPPGASFYLLDSLPALNHQRSLLDEGKLNEADVAAVRTAVVVVASPGQQQQHDWDESSQTTATSEPSIADTERERLLAEQAQMLKEVETKLQQLEKAGRVEHVAPVNNNPATATAVPLLHAVRVNERAERERNRLMQEQERRLKEIEAQLAQLEIKWRDKKVHAPVMTASATLAPTTLVHSASGGGLSMGRKSSSKSLLPEDNSSGTEDVVVMRRKPVDAD